MVTDMNGGKRLEPVGVEVEYSFPASSTQTRVLVGERQACKASAYNIVHAWRLMDDIDADILEAAANAVITQHDLLRAVFTENDEAFECHVLKSAKFTLIRRASQTTQEELKYFAAEPFSLTEAPPLRLGLFNRIGGGKTLVLSMHHVVADDISIEIFCADLCAAYERIRKVIGKLDAPLIGRFADLVAVESAFAQKKQYQDQLAMLVASVRDRLPTTFMPRPLPPSLQEPEDGFSHRTIPEGLADRIGNYCRQTNSTPFIFYATVFGILAARYSGEEECLFGIVTGSRPSAALRHVCGNFVNTIPVYLSIDGASFSALFPSARTSILRAVECNGVPYNDVLRAQASQGNAPLPVRIAFLEKRPTPKISFGGVSAQPEQLWIGATKLDLTAYLVRNSGMVDLCVEYSNRYYTAGCVQMLLDAFLLLAEDCLDRPDIPLSSLPLLSGERREQAIAQSFGPEIVIEDVPVTNAILRHCEASADCVAASDVSGDGVRRELSYRELGTASLAVMTALNAAGIAPNDRVGVYMPRGIELTIAILGVLRAGCVYVPLDSDIPEHRLREQAAIVSAVLVVPDAKGFASLAATTVLAVDSAAQAEGALPSDLARSNGDAYLIYTSGTTSTPNGVVNTHHALRNRLDWMGRAYPIGPRDVVLHKTPISFDVSVWELIWPLMHGARIHHARSGGHKDASYLDGLIVSESVTVLHFVPSMLGHFLEATQPGRRGSVRHLICSGESLPRNLADRWRERFGGRVHNLYGPTEAAIDVTAFDYEKAEADPMLPIGCAIQNTAIFILDRYFAPVPTGAIGDLYIAGKNLADRYFEKPELTDKKFVRQEVGHGRKLRLYRTGDRARRRADGAILFEGRQDSQVKLNGVRIELEEIEASLRAHPDIIDAVVVLQTDGESYLSAFFRSRRTDLDNAALDDWLIPRIPRSHIPSAYECMEEFPVTVSGKIDRKAFAILERGTIGRQRAFVSPKNGIELAIARVWEDILGKSPIGVDDNFYALGGDSLRSLRCVSRLRKLGLAIEVVEFLKNPTIRQLAGVVQLSQGAVGGEPGPQSMVRRYPAPSLVQALWVGSEVRADYRSYVTAYRIRGLFDLEALQKAVDAVVRRHSILRSTLRADAHGRAFIEIEDDARVVVEIESFEQADPEAEVVALTQWFNRATRCRWRWDTAPLFRCVVHRFTIDTFQITFVEPWLDGWSVQILALELFVNYVELIENGNLLEKPALSDSFANFAAAEEAAISDLAHVHFWRGALANTPETRILQEGRDGRQFRIEVDLGTSAKKLRALASRHGVPLKSLLMGVHSAVVSVLAGAQTLTIGVMFNGRLERVGGDCTLGCYLNALPVTMNLSGINWLDLARRCLEKEIEITPWRRYPLDGLRRQSGNDLFDTLFNYTDFSMLRQAPSTPIFELVDRVGFDQTYMALTAQFGHDLEAQDVTLYLEVIEPVRNRFGAKELAGLYESAFAACCNAPEVSVEAWRVLAVSERNASRFSEVHAPEESLIGLFNAQVEIAPGNVALTDDAGVTVTFGELRDRVAEIAAGLQEINVGTKDIVGVHLPRSPEFVASILAVQAVGGIFLPLPLDMPSARHRFMAEDSDVRCVIVGAHRPSDDAFDCEVLSVEDLCAIGAGATGVPDGPIGPEDGVHILYTSGSTGRPKGVLTPQRVVLNRLLWMWRAFPFEADEVVAQKTTFAFVDSIWEILGGLLAGVRTHLFEEKAARDPIAFVDEIERRNCTRVTLTPSFAEALLRDCRDLAKKLASVRVLVLSGEPLKPGLAMHLAALLPRAKVVNLYGSTETGGDASFFVFDPALVGQPWPIVPLGYPISNCCIDIADSNGSPALPGVVGDIIVSGACVCAGYVGWARDKDPMAVDTLSLGPWQTGDLGYVDLEGCLHYIGRADRQVKVRGVRIHPAEIEEAVRNHPQIGESVCVVDPRGLLVLFFTSNENRVVMDVRDWLANCLPSSHVPSRAVRVDQIPKSLSGKADHASLLAMETKLSADLLHSNPTATEELVMEELRTLLGNLQLTPSADFFAIGGDSLAAATLVRRLSARFNVVLPVRAVFEAPVVQDLAARIDHQCLTTPSGRI
jgi:amino acid adenylation domain-containing protein